MLTLFDGFELEDLDQHTWLKGQLIFARKDWHEITVLEVDSNGDIDLQGRILGTRKTPYVQFVRLSRMHSHASKWQVHGVCSCPVGFNCKHSAALLLFAKKQLQFHLPGAIAKNSNQLPLELCLWLNQWQHNQHIHNSPRPATQTPPAEFQLFYLLHAGQGHLWLSLYKIKRKDLQQLYEYKKLPKLHPVKKSVLDLITDMPNYVHPETDLPILLKIAPSASGIHGQQHLCFPVSGLLGEQVLDHLEATGRTGHRLPKGELATWEASSITRHAQPSDIDLVWNEIDENNHQRGPAYKAAFNLKEATGKPGELVWMPLPHLYFSHSNTLQRVNLPIHENAIRQLSMMPPVPAKAMPDLANLLCPTLPESWAKNTARLCNVKSMDHPPQFRVRLTKTGRLGNQLLSDTFWPNVCEATGDRVIVLEMSYDQANWLGVPAHCKQRLLKLEDDQGNTVLYTRHHTHEQNALNGFCMDLPAMAWLVDAMLDERKEMLVKAIHKMQAEPGDHDIIFNFCRVPDQATSWPELIEATQAWCASQGMEFKADEDCNIKRLHNVQIELAVERQQEGWLDASFSILMEDHPVSLADVLHQTLDKNPDLFETITKGMFENITVCIDEEQGLYADLSIDQLQPILHLLQRLLNSKNAVLSLPGWELGELQAAAEHLQVTAPDSIRDVITNFDAVIRDHQIQISSLFRATLRPYQQEGVAWIQLLAKLNMNGLLADDMGLGKTVQTLAVLSTQGENDVALVIAPNSLVHNWAREADQFLPHFKVICLGAGQQPLIEELTACQLVVCPFSMVYRLRWALESIQWTWLVVDESQRIKNANTQSARTIKQIKATRRLALSGTPIENHLGELWSQLDFLMPGLLGSRKEFDNNWRKPIEKDADPWVANRLAARIKPFIKRRTKAEVAKELPLKTEQIIRVPLGPKQAQAYETVRATMDKRLRDILSQKGFAKSQILFLEALLRLRQICCDPALVNDKAPSAKLELLLDLLQTLVVEKRTVLVFSQFAEMLHRIEAELRERDISCLKLTGQTKNREELIEQFRTGAAPVFLISLKAGGVGLNLTEADTVIMFDPWWNPAAEQQAVDRAHRIGQTRQVNVIRLIAENTVEEKILKLQDRKNDIAKQVLAGKQLDTVLNEEDFLEMLAAGTNQSQDL